MAAAGTYGGATAFATTSAADQYMSVLLAAVYYLTQMRSEKPDALPDGEEKRA